MSNEDEIARLRAQMDQAVEGAKEFARGLWAFYGEAKDSGFTEDQAMVLTLAWLAEMMTVQIPGDDE